jgi:hypothetical protein
VRWVFTSTHRAERDGGVGFVVLFIFGMLLVPWRFISVMLFSAIFFEIFSGAAEAKSPQQSKI